MTDRHSLHASNDAAFIDGALAYRPEAAAKLLGVSRRTLDGWAADGLIHPLKVGPGRAGLVLYPRRELVAFLVREAQKQAAQRQVGGSPNREGDE